MTSYSDIRKVILEETEKLVDLGSSPVITEDSKFMEDLKLDSLELISVIVELETKFNIEIANNEFVAVVTVMDMIKLVKGKLDAKA